MTTGRYSRESNAIDRPYRYRAQSQSHREASPLPDTASDRESTLFARMVSISDGVFGISLTLLVLNIAVPADTTTGNIGTALSGLTTNFIALAVTVFVIAVAWKNHHQLFASFRGLTMPLVSLNFVYLGLVALIPFPNSLISTYQGDPWSYVVFAGVFTTISVIDILMMIYANRNGLLRTELSPRMVRIDMLRGVLTAIVFAVSIPLAFILVAWTPLVWVLLLGADELVVRVAATD
ncbi:DUF1211 domain-containing protein [Halorubraceae archaeon YAN]|nr:DUF1211 domain-containing protein [Halorubraceae archaeon YAN]